MAHLTSHRRTRSPVQIVALPTLSKYYLKLKMPQHKPEYNESVPTTRRGDRRKSHETPIVDILHVVNLTCSN